MLTPAALFFFSLTGCETIQGLIGGDGPESALAEASATLVGGDLPSASDAYASVLLAHPDNVDAATGAAYTALLQGDTDSADASLAAVEATAGERLSEVQLRRALVALQARDLEKVREYGEASATPEGLLFAAEVALADGEREDAAELLARVSGGTAGLTAQAYIALIEDADPLVAGLSEAQALWALGEHKIAVRSVEELIKALPDAREDRDEMLLVWSSRAASVGETDTARSLLESVIFPPKGQAWRKVATQAIIACAEGDAETCTSLLDKLEGNAPTDGIADACATAAVLIASDNPEVARELAGRYTSNASARALHEAGDRSGAAESASDGPLRKYLQGG
jgi:thioredoxin-like negative regulator of GroEL